MNLSKNEIAAFLSLILEKNPITDIVLEHDRVSIKHFDGRKTDLALDNHVDVYTFKEQTIEEDYSAIEDYVQYSNTEQVRVNDYIEEAKVKIETYIAKTDREKEQILSDQYQSLEETYSEHKELLQQYFDKLESKFENNSIKTEEIQSIVNAQLDRTMENLGSMFEMPAHQPTEKIETIREIIKTSEYDDSNIVSWAQGLFDGLKEDLEKATTKVSSKVKNHDKEISRLEKLISTKKHEAKNTTDSNIREQIETLQAELKLVNETNVPVNYQYIENLIDTKLTNYAELMKTDPVKSIVAIENKNNRLIIRHSDKTFQDITDVFIPVLQLNFRNFMGTRGGPLVGGGAGGGAGSQGVPGLSAYEIALNNGFEGSEQQWIDSLKGDYSPPEDGLILYDSADQIEQIIVGSKTTLFIRDDSGTILSIQKADFTKTFLRDDEDRIIGWEIS